jgi:hypothetical protein
MPFKSKSQQKYMFSQHPEIAKRWAAETPNMKSLPEKKGNAMHHLNLQRFKKKRERKRAVV